MSYTRTCESCGKVLVEVDNPIRREFRHRRGDEQWCHAWREAVGLPPLSERADSDANGDTESRPLGAAITSESTLDTDRP